MGRTSWLFVVLLAAACAIAQSAVPACAATHVVKPDGSGDYTTIQDAIDAAGGGDIIELTDGTFTGNGNRDIDYGGKAITIRSQSGNPASCVIDCGGSELDSHRGFHFHSAEGAGSVLQGVTVTNGHVEDQNHVGGGGICCDGCSPTISNCVISGNSADGDTYHPTGAGISCRNFASPTITGCVISGNLCGVGGIKSGYGGGIYCYSNSCPAISGCTITGNNATYLGGGLYTYYAGPTLTGCVLSDNTAGSGGGVFAGDGDSMLEGCTIVGNSAGFAGGGIYCGSEAVSLANTIVAFSSSGGGVYYPPTGRLIPSVVCCDVYGNAGGNYGGGIPDQTDVNGNISEDPLFCDAAGGDYSIDLASLCSAANNPTCGLVGAWDVGCDSPVEQMSWGRVKALFR